MKLQLILALLFVVAVTCVPAIYDGQRRFRWGNDEEVRELANRLNAFPKVIGEWEMLSEVELDEASANQLQPLAIVNRVYFNRSTQRQANVFVLLGPTGPTAVHTPDICFNSRNYRKLGKRRVTKVSPESRLGSKCFQTQFQSRDVNTTYLDTWYAWTVDGTWQAPEQPRYHFANNRYLFKIQIVTRYATRDELDNEAMTDFVKTIDETLRRQVF